jgi:peptidoglycan hydrolase-like protein with peptidoglycan-binding domain
LSSRRRAFIKNLFIWVRAILPAGGSSRRRLAEKPFEMLEGNLKPFWMSIVLLLAPTPALSDIWTFETPSENIQCVVGQDFNVLSGIDCTIIERSGPPARPRPQGCTEGWGHLFSMQETGPVEMACGYPSRDKSGFDRADYGVTGNFGGFTCHSSTKGLRCTNRDGNGFFLSKRRQQIIGQYRNKIAARQPVLSPQPQAPVRRNSTRWQSEFGQGIVETSVGDGLGAELGLVCNISGLDTIPSSLSLSFEGPAAATVPAGSTVEFLFDGRRAVSMVFNDENRLYVENNAASIKAFSALVRRLKRHGFVVVRLPDGRQMNFTLRGSSKAIWKCPATPSSAPVQIGTAPANQPAATASPAAGGSAHRFSDYPATATLQGPPNYPDFKGRDRDYRDYRTRIRDGVSGGVNFAGHYSFVVIGCGTDCRFGFVIDLRTGKVFDFPYGGEEQYQMDLRFNAASRLVKVRWKGDWQSETCTEKDLLVEATGWRVLAERKVPTNDGLCYYPFEEVVGQSLAGQTTSSETQTVSSDAVHSPAKPESPDAAPSPAQDAPAPNASAAPDIKAQWLDAEQKLKELGFDPGPVDGVVDGATVEAVSAFQRAYGLDALGFLPPEHITILNALVGMQQRGPESSAPPDETEKAEKLLRDLDLRAERVREQLVSNPAYIVALLGREIEPELLPVFVAPDTIPRLLEPAIAFPGCWDEKTFVVGFYNVVQHIWLVLGVDKDDTIKTARLAPGFRPASLKENIAWYDLLEDGSSSLKALQSAAAIQIASFVDLFGSESCLDNLENAADLFSAQEVSRLIDSNEAEFGNTLPDIVGKITSSTKIRHNISEDQKLISFGTIAADTADGANLLSVHTMASDRTLLLVQTWKEDRGEVRVVGNALGRLNGGTGE